MNRILLDTHMLLRMAYGALDPKRKALLSRPGLEVGYSQISLWEIAKLYEKKRLTLLNGIEDALVHIENHPKLVGIPIHSGMLLELLPIAEKMQKDPADQMIVATAMHWNATLLTDDEQIRSLKFVKTA